MSEIMAMLTAQSVKMEGVGGGRGSVTPQLVAASLRGLDDELVLYGCVKFSGDDISIAPLAKLMLTNTLNAALREGWRISKRESVDTVKRLSIVALNESVCPRRCLRCRGAGTLNNKGACDRCNGTGNPQDYGQKLLASVLNVSEGRAGAFWQEKLRRELSVYQGFEQDIADKLKKELKD